MIIQSKRVYVDEKLQPLQIEITDNKITNVLPYGCYGECVDYGDAIILPGLMDIHSHGYMHGDCNYATDEWLKEWAEYLPSEGITSIMFTFSCGKHESVIDSLKKLKEFVKTDYAGAKYIATYSEGPYIGQKPGAQEVEYKLIPTEENVNAFNEACGGMLRYVMLAPEELENLDIIKYCVKKGIKVALGHTDASFELCQKAIEAGSNSFTHTYNGMNGLHHREPGVTGAAMYFEDCYAELICDGAHVNKIAANILARLKGKDRLLLITDSVGYKGMEVGQYPFEGGMMEVCADGVVRLPDGTINGSCNKLNKVLRYAIKEAKIDPVIAYNAACKNPYEFLGMNTKGKIAIGYDADLAVFNDEYDTITTYILGKEYKI